MGNCIQYYCKDCPIGCTYPNQISNNCSYLDNYCDRTQNISYNNCSGIFCNTQNNQICGYSGNDCYSQAVNELASNSQQYTNPTISIELKNAIYNSSEEFKQYVPVSLNISEDNSYRRIETVNYYGQLISYVNYQIDYLGQIQILGSNNASINSTCNGYNDNSFGYNNQQKCDINYSAKFGGQELNIYSVANYIQPIYQTANSF
jgi:hypothetical protein